MDSYYKFIIYYNDQVNKTKLFLENIRIVYPNINNIVFHFISGKDLVQELKDYLSFYNLKYLVDIDHQNSFLQNSHNILRKIIEESEETFIILQDIIVVHKKTIIFDLVNENYNRFIKNENIHSFNNFVPVYKKINKPICNEFKNKILTNTFPDILLFAKNDYLNITDKNILDYKFNNIIESDDIDYLFPKNIPKKIHFYWDGSKGCYLTWLCFKTFVFYNPGWEVNIWMPKIVFKNKTSCETSGFCPPHGLTYDGIDYLDYDYLREKLDIKIRNVEYYDLNLKKNINEIFKSDIFRWKILAEEGGVWSDSDILFVNHIENTDFEKYSFNFNEIDTVVSFYSRQNRDNEQIDFYYIGFLMSAPGSEFYKKLYQKTVEGISYSKDSCQQFGAESIFKNFGKYDEIKNVVNSKYANLQSDSVYHYCWDDLSHLFENDIQGEYVNYVRKNSKIIGYLWFRGSHMAKIYTLFFNQQVKIQNSLDFGLISHHVERFSLIFNDLKPPTPQKKISIVMTYIKRLEQLRVTLQTISASKYTNFEIIIVDDGNEDISFIKSEFNWINIIIVKNQWKYVNPCMAYNFGFTYATGEIIMIQNSECCHIGDLLAITNCLLMPNDYLIFPCYYLESFEKNKVLKEILGHNINWDKQKLGEIYDFTENFSSININANFKGWVSHLYYNPSFLHFCSAIYRDKLMEIECFSSIYKDGLCFDDDDLVRKCYSNNLNMYYFPITSKKNEFPALHDHTGFVIHQHHNRIVEYGENSKEIFLKNKNIFIIKSIDYIRIYIEKNYKNKDFFKDASICLKNCYVLNYSDGIYTIHSSNEKNSFKIIPFISKKVIEYIFNGKSYILKNNIVKLLNNCDFDIIIETNSADKIDLKINKKDRLFLEPSNYENNLYRFIYSGKIDILKFKICNFSFTKIRFFCRIINITNIDNTIFIDENKNKYKVKDGNIIKKKIKK